MMKNLPVISIYLLLGLLIILVSAIALELLGIQLGDELDSGWAALLGALIGSGTTAIFNLWQQRMVFRNARLEATIESKKMAYADAIAHMATATVSLMEGKHFPADFGDKEKEMHHKTMSNLLLFAGPEVSEYRKQFLRAYPDSDDQMPTTSAQLSAKFDELKSIQQKARTAMRRELGLE